MEHIGRYQIIAELGKGAMGVVYKATDPNIGRTVAVKTLRLDIHGMEADEMLHRFKNEARAAGVMNHPNIITIYDAGELEGMFYIAMEFIEGQTLQDLLKQEKVLPVDRVTDIVRQVCAGLDYAHARGIIHRDIKPANIMITDGTVKIMDFGIAKGGGTGMTSTGQVVGTPNYMSPEQVKGKTLDGRTDLFSLGVVLYETITGERPFAGQNVTTIIYKIVNETPPAPRDLDASVHPGLSAVVMKALAKAPEQRYATGADFARDLQNYKSLGTDTSKVTAAPAPSVRPIEPHVDTVTIDMPPAAEAAATAAAVAAAAKPAVQKSAALDSTVAAHPPAAVRPPAPPPRKTGPMVAIIAAVVVVALAVGVYWRSHRAAQPANPPAAQATTPAPAVTKPEEQPAAPALRSMQPSPAPSKEIAAAPAVPGPAKPAPSPAAASGDLQITSTPFGAKVTLDGRSEPTWVTPFAAAKLKPGRHTVNFALDGHQPETRQIEVVAGKKLPLHVQLQAVKGYLSLNSVPAGAAIYLDGRDTGQVTPARVTVNPGQHRIALRKEGFKPQITNAEVTAGQVFNFAPALEPAGGKQEAAATGAAAPQSQGANPFRKLRRLFGKAPADDGVLEVHTKPKGAEIWLGDAQAPSKTPAKFAVAPGTYKLTLRLTGYKPITRSVQIEKGKTMGLEEVFDPQ